MLLPLKVHAGSRNREISDGLLLAGERGVVLQTKNRAAARSDPDREAAWVTKKIADAARQVHGTARRLRSGPVEMTNGRGRRVRVVGEGVSWVGVVIIDHPHPPVDLPLVDHSSSSTAVVTLLRREWEFLFDQLRSTRAVIDYLHRVAGPCACLGEEPERYFELATADAAAEPDPVPPGLEGNRVSAPLLPLEPAGHTDDPAHGIVRIICEDIATSPMDAEEHERSSLLAAIDRLAVAHRSDLGQLVLEELRIARTIVGDDIRWRFRTYRTPLETPQVGIGVCSVLNDNTRAAFRSWVLLRHHERGSVDELDDALTIGVLLTPRHDGLRDWDTTMLAVRGDPCLDDDDLERSRRLWNSSGTAGTGPNTPSP